MALRPTCVLHDLPGTMRDKKRHNAAQTQHLLLGFDHALQFARPCADPRICLNVRREPAFVAAMDLTACTVEKTGVWVDTLSTLQFFSVKILLQTGRAGT